MTDPLHIDVPLWGWVAFNVYVVVLLLVDLLLFNRKAHKIEWREAAWLSAFFVVAFAFTNHKVQGARAEMAEIDEN